MNLEWYDKHRFDHEWAADQDVLTRLREQGDRADKLRTVDVSFRGDENDLVRAQECATQCGFDSIGTVELEGEEFRLDVSRQQAANAQAIKELTILALQIEAACNVIYDGWGCVTQNDKA